jgi:putative transposase
LLEQRKNTYEESGKSLSLYTQINNFAALKQERESLKTVHSQVLQNVAVRLDLAFKAFFRRVKAGEVPGYPRFRGFNRYDSFCYPQSGFKVEGHHLKLSKIGNLHIKLHRPIEGKIKTCCLRRSSTGKWYASFACEIEDPQPLPESLEQVGIDVGLTTFAYLSTDERIENPRFFRKEERALTKAQRRLSKEEKGTPERAKRRKPVSRVHERIKFKRHNFTHQESRKIVNRFGVICVEDLSVNRMMHNRCLSKSIADAAWSGFSSCLSFKAENAGRRYVAINPAYTSQDCSRCGHRQKMPLEKRKYVCPCCHLEINRDLNAAKNILAHGLVSIGIQSVEAPAFTHGE